MEQLKGLLARQKEILSAADQGMTRKNCTQKPEEPQCAACSDTGWVPSLVEGRVRECECKKRRIAQGRIREILKNWPEYKDAQLETFKPRSVRQQNAIRAIRENPTGSYFLGGYYQQGKTHLLVAQYRWMADAGMRCILLSAQELMDDLRKAETPMDGQPPYESPVLRMVDFAGSGHLFIDDIEKAPSRSGFRAEMLFSVLDRIKRRQLGLSVTSNLPLISEDEKDLRQKLTDEVAARIDQICSQIDM